MRRLRITCLFIACLAAPVPVPAEKPRLLVLTDMGADPDDQQSFVRLLLYANEFEIEGLIATSAGTTGKREQHATHPEMIRELVTAYGQVWPNLSKHAARYPPANDLLEKIKVGSSRRGKEAVGEGLDTEASESIVAITDKADPRPLCVSIWGGQTDLAQALWRVKRDRGDEGLKQFATRLRIYDVADQDGLASWIQTELKTARAVGEPPMPLYIQAGAEAGLDKREGSFRGMYLGGDETFVSREWMETNVRNNHGPLGALYPPKTWTAPNPHGAIKEGDTPSWMYFLPQGLNDIGHPEWGGFGGRFTQTADGVYRDARDAVAEVRDARATVWRWREAVQAEFAARMDWCVAERYEKANHPPVVLMNGDRSRDVLRLKAKAGERITLSAAGSSDPDGAELSYCWFVYPEASDLLDEVVMASEEGVSTSFAAPKRVFSTVHLILQVSDNGSPPLTAFRRAVIEVTP